MPKRRARKSGSAVAAQFKEALAKCWDRLTGTPAISAWSQGRWETRQGAGVFRRLFQGQEDVLIAEQKIDTVLNKGGLLWTS